MNIHLKTKTGCFKGDYLVLEIIPHFRNSMFGYEEKEAIIIESADDVQRALKETILKENWIEEVLGYKNNQNPSWKVQIRYEVLLSSGEHVWVDRVATVKANSEEHAKLKAIHRVQIEVSGAYQIRALQAVKE